MKRMIATSLGGALILWAGYNLWFFSGDNYRTAVSPIPVSWHQWALVEGEGEVRRDGIEMSFPGRYGYAFAAGQLISPIPSQRVEGILIRFESVEGAHEIISGVSLSPNLGAIRETRADLLDDGQAYVDAGEFLFGPGEVHFVIIKARGRLDPPVQIDSVELHFRRPAFLDFQRMLVASLVDRGLWTQRSINHQIPEYSPLRVFPVVSVFLWIGLSMLLYWLMFLRGQGMRLLALPALAYLLAGWLALDLAWQSRLILNYSQAISSFAGKSPDEKRLVEFDGDVFGFVSELKRALEDETRPVVIFGNSAFTHFRARYFALPQPVVSREGYSPAWMRRLRPGDTLALIHLPGELVETALDPSDFETDSAAAEEFVLEGVVGRNAELGTSNGLPEIRMKEEEGPWLIESDWLDFPAGAWRLEADLAATDQPGWLRIEMLAREPGQRDVEVMAWREVFVRDGNFRQFTMPFVVDDEREIHLRVRELDAGGSRAAGLRTIPLNVEDGMVLLSPDGQPPFWLATKVTETEVGVAYHIH